MAGEKITLSLLQGMAKAGLIVLHGDTGKQVRHWTGRTVKALYVSDVRPGVAQPFEFRGRKYKLRYFDGCFCPFVVPADYTGDGVV